MKTTVIFETKLILDDGRESIFYLGPKNWDIIPQ